MSNIIYLDNAATTKVDPQVFEEMKPYLSEYYGNSHSKYYDLANISKSAIEKAKKQIASFVNCDEDEIFFNSGATEGNNHVLKGTYLKYFNKQKNIHFITTNIEHSSIIETMNHLESLGVEVTYLKVKSNGQINLKDLEEAIQPNTKLISIGYVNSEIGVVQDLKNISEICQRFDIKFHSDFTQAIGKLKVDLDDLRALNYITFSGHKFYGPKGIGILVARKDKDGIRTKLPIYIHGGNQDEALRAGTMPIHLIVGVGKACELMQNNLFEHLKHLKELDSYLLRKLEPYCPEIIKFNNNFNHRVYGIINIQFKGYNNQILLKSAKSVFAASTGSACSTLKPSHVLKSIGLKVSQIRESVRISLGKNNSTSDIDTFIEALFD
jgi:cysteine desulfurase